MNRLPNNNSDPLPEAAIEKARLIISEEKTAVFGSMILIAWPYFIMRLIQWHRLNRKYPVLAAGDGDFQTELTKEFRWARTMLWVAALSPVGSVLLILCIEKFG